MTDFIASKRLIVATDVDTTDEFTLGGVISSGPWVDVRYYSTFAAAITAADGKTLLITEDVTDAGGNTVPVGVTLHFLADGKLSGSGTVTINGSIVAPPVQIFDTVTVAGDLKVDCVYPEWWGAQGDDSTDDTTAIQAAMDLHPVVRFGAKTYLMTRVECNDQQDLGGAGMYATVLKLPDSTDLGRSGDVKYFGIMNDAASENTQKISIHDLSYDGNESNNTSWQGDISDYDELKASGISFAATVAHPYGPDSVSIYNVYVHDTIRNCFSIQTSTGHLNMTNIHTKNAALDHHFYIRTIGPANISNVRSEGFARSAYYVTAGCQLSNVVLHNTVVNPYIAYDFVNNTNVVFNPRNSAGEGTYTEGTQVNNFTGYIDSEYFGTVIDIGTTGNHFGHAFTNFRIFQTNDSESTSTDFTFCKNATDAVIYGLVMDNILVNNVPDGFRFLYGVASISALMIQNVYLAYRSGESFSSSNFLFRPTGTSTGWKIDNFIVNTGPDRFMQLSSTGTFTNFSISNVNMESQATDTRDPIVAQGTYSHILVTNCKFNLTLSGGTALNVIKYRDCTFTNGVSNAAGVYTISGDGSETSFTIAHGLAASPRTVNASVGGAWLTQSAFKVSKNSTNITIVFDVAPANVEDNVSVGWTAAISGIQP